MKILDIPIKRDEAWYRPTGEPVYDINIRTARKDGLFPRVTNIIGLYPKPFLDSWKIEQAILAALTLPRIENEPLEAFAKRVVDDSQRQTKDTAEWGTQFHSYIERIMAGAGVVPEELNSFQPFVYNWSQWFHAQVQEVLALERVVVSNAYGYAGRMDHLWVMDGEVMVADTKTRSVKGGKPAFYDEQAMQLAAYGRCLPNMELPAPTCYMSVIVNRDRPEPPYVKIWKPEEIELGWQRFRACFELWKAVQSYNPAAPSSEP